MSSKKELTKKWKQNNRERERLNRRRNALNEYGLTLEDYDSMLKSQNGACKICGRQDTGSSRVKNFHVDHCHSTGKVRGLLCNNCNRGIGYLGDNIERLEKALEYLRFNHVRKS